MTYNELSQVKTTGFTTNHVIDDIVSTARWAYTKKGFQTAEVTEKEMNRIREAAQKEGAAFAADGNATAKRTKAAWIRDEGYPAGKPAPGHFNCHCGVRVSQVNDRNTCVNCGTIYNAQGWIIG